MEDKNIKNKFFKGALILMLFGFLSKIIGAVYRIPLTRVVGSEGMGLYQIVFPLYTLMLTISSSGLPSSISKLISENVSKRRYKQVEKILKVSFLLLFVFSMVCATLVLVLSKTIAGLQGNLNARICYFGIAPAIVFVGGIAGFRGYFQGFENMIPSAVSTLIEQIVKMLFGLFFATKFIVKGVNFGVFGAMLGISLSELIALVYLFISYLFYKKKNKILLKKQDLTVESNKKTLFSILSLSCFVTLGGLIMPLTMLIDGSLVINVLKEIGINQTLATKMFGLQTGIVGAIINMPVVLSLGISTSILPCLSRLWAQKDIVGVKTQASKALFLTMLLALPASVGCMAFAEPIIRLLYSRSLSVCEIKVSAQILEIASVGIFYLAMVQVSAGILQGISKFYIPLISLTCGAVVKTILNVVLLHIKDINIYGAEVATVSCYICALIINLICLKKNGVVCIDLKVLVLFVASLMIYFSKYLFKFLLMMNINYFFALFLSVLIVVLLYFVVVFILYVLPQKIKKRNKSENI